MQPSYPYLPPNRKFIYVPITDRFMAEAKKVTLTQSTERNHPTGAVIVKDGVLIGSGANQSALKSPWLQAIHKKYICIRRLLKIPTGQKYWLCPGCSQSKHHAECQSLRNVLSGGLNPQGADLYMWGHWWCCKSCWDTMIAAGIKDVYLVEEATEQFKR